MSRRRSSARGKSRVEGLDGSGSGSEDVEDAEDDMVDALGRVVSVQTAALRKKTSAQGNTIKDLEATVKRLIAQVDHTVVRETYVREVDDLRRDVKEALELSQRAGSNTTLSVGLLREEMLTSMRKELGDGLAAGHSLANAHSGALSELNMLTAEMNARVATLEVRQRTAESDGQAKVAALEERAAAELRAAEREARAANAEAEAKAEAARLSLRVETLEQAIESMRAQGSAAAKEAARSHEATSSELDELRQTLREQQRSLSMLLGGGGSGGALGAGDGAVAGGGGGDGDGTQFTLQLQQLAQQKAEA